MPNLSPNVGFNLFLENECVDWDQINANFEKLDKMCLCIESGTKTASYSGGVTGNATWRYKKYSDGTIEMYTKIGFDTLKCDQGSKAPYYTVDSKAYFPITLIEIEDVQMHMASNTVGWIEDITGKNVVDCRIFRFRGMESESNYVYKQAFISVKGRWK